MHAVTTSSLGLGVPLPVVCALFRSRSASSSPFSLLISALALRSIPAAVSLDTFGVCPLRICWPVLRSAAACLQMTDAQSEYF